MKKLLILLLTFFIFSAGQLPALQLSNELEITEIGQGLYLVTHSFPWAANSLLVAMDDRNMLWLDTPYTPEATAEVLDWLYSKYGTDCSVTEINTGFHIDNLGGNAELIRRGIPVYGSTLTCELLETRSRATMLKMSGWLQGRRNEKYRNVYSDFRFYCPTVTFNISEEPHLRIGSEEAVIYYPGPTHTYDNLTVYIPGRKLLFGGCMILSADAEKPGYVEDGNLKEWASSLERLKTRFPDPVTVVPGHGSPGDLSLIAHTITVVESNIGP